MDSPKIIAVVQARMGSTRLPKKVTLPLGRKSVIEQIFERLSTSRLLNGTILATSLADADRPLRALARLRGWDLVAGSEQDVLSRFVLAVRRYRPDHVVRVTADCPLVDVEGMDECIETHLRERNDYTHNASDTGFERIRDGCSLGLAVEVVRAETLLALERYPLRPQHREHVTTLLLENPESFKVRFVPARHSLLRRSDVRLTLDTPEDYGVLRRVYEALYRPGRPIDPVEAVTWLDEHPDVNALNRDVPQLRLKATYQLMPDGALVERLAAGAGA